MQQSEQRTSSVLACGVAGVAGATVLGAVGLAAAGAYVAVMLNERTPTTVSNLYSFSPFETNIAGFEEITIPTPDGLLLAGWWLPNTNAHATIVGFGGHRSSGSDLLGIGSGLWRVGYNVLLFDWRSRGRSPIAQHSLAYYELRDAQAAIDYACQRAPATPIGVVGFSMGAAISILVAARDTRIRAVVADSPFTSIRDVVEAGARRRLPARPVTHLADAITTWRYGYRFDDVRPIDAIHGLAPRPIFLIHGTGDSVIPSTHSQRLYDRASGPKDLWILPELEHCQAYFVDRPGYIARVADFFARHVAIV